MTPHYLVFGFKLLAAALAIATIAACDASQRQDPGAGAQADSGPPVSPSNQAGPPLTKGEVHASHDKAKQERFRHPTPAEIHAAHPKADPLRDGPLTKADAHAMHGNESDSRAPAEKAPPEK